MAYSPPISTPCKMTLIHSVMALVPDAVQREVMHR
jgi:hypothetical protein